MEADSRSRCVLAHAAALALVVLLTSAANAANFRTQNFIIQAPDPGLAKAVGEAAEKYRHDLAMYWLGKSLPPWPAPCPIRVISGPTLAAQGVTTYNPAPVRDFQMEVVGTPERILDSVLPHEVTHTVLATHFGRPLPRWADEGICTTVEHDSERMKHEAKLREFLRSRRGIPMNQLFLMTEYPNDVLPMYAQGYSVCQFLIGQKGPRAFIDFLHDYVEHPSWTANVRKHYQYDSLAELQSYWVDWVSAGSGPVERFAKVATASTTSPPNDRVAQVAAIEQIKTPQPKVAVVQADSSPHAAAPRSAAVPRSAVAPRSAAESSSAGGWYDRQKTQPKSPQSKLASSAIRPLIPPSVRQSGRYQSSQPQPEGGISKSGSPVSRVSGGYNAVGSRF